MNPCKNQNHQNLWQHAIWMAGFLALTAMPASSETPAPIDYPARVQSVENLKQYIAKREARFESLKKDMLDLDARVEKQIEDIVHNLAGLQDSNDSKTRVANIKEDVIEGLIRNIWIIKRKRSELFERMRKESSVPAAELEKNLKAFDDRIAKRLDQVMELAKSFPGHQDLKKYEEYGDSYYDGYYVEHSRISDDWKQNRRDNTSGRVARREVLEDLEKAIEDNEFKRRAVTNTLANTRLSAEERALQEEEAGRLDAAIETLTAKRRELVLPAGGAGREIGGDEAHDAELMLDDARRDLARDFAEIMRRYSELDAERTRIADMKKNLALREEWLKNNPPPTE